MKNKMKEIFLLFQKNVRYQVIIVALVFSVILLLVSYSYALFTIRHEQKNAVSLVAGTLVYTIESDRLQDRQIVVSANSTEIFEVNIVSNNIIDSYYQLYYEGTLPEGVNIYYIRNTGQPNGNIGPDGSNKTVTVVIQNNSKENYIATLGVQGGFTDRPLFLEQEKKAITERYERIVTVNQSSGGIITVTNITKQLSSTNKISAEPGDQIKVSVALESEYQIKTLTYNNDIISNEGIFTMEMDHVTVQGTFIYKDGWHQDIYYLCGKKYKHRIANYMGSPSIPGIAEALVDSNGLWQQASTNDVVLNGLYLYTQNTANFGSSIYWVINGSEYNKAEMVISDFYGQAGDYITLSYVRDGYTTPVGTNYGIGFVTVQPTLGGYETTYTLTVKIDGENGLILASVYSGTKHGKYVGRIVSIDLYYKDFVCT